MFLNSRHFYKRYYNFAYVPFAVSLHFFVFLETFFRWILGWCFCNIIWVWVVSIGCGHCWSHINIFSLILLSWVIFRCESSSCYGRDKSWNETSNIVIYNNNRYYLSFHRFYSLIILVLIDWDGITSDVVTRVNDLTWLKCLGHIIGDHYYNDICCNVLESSWVEAGIFGAVNFWKKYKCVIFRWVTH